MIIYKNDPICDKIPWSGEINIVQDFNPIHTTAFFKKQSSYCGYSYEDEKDKNYSMGVSSFTVGHRFEMKNHFIIFLTIMKVCFLI